MHDGIDFDKNAIEKNLTLFLYPDDSDRAGQLLRIYQQYFMVSNAAQLILSECRRKCEKEGKTLKNLNEFAVIQINDTHPTMVIPELIRILTTQKDIMDFMSVSSYGDDTSSSGVVRIVKDLDETIEGKDVLIVEDIIDSGRTLSHLIEILKQRNPKSLRLCTLLDKPERRVKDVKVDYVCFNIPDEFVVGYGLDYAQKYRNLPYIGVVEL